MIKRVCVALYWIAFAAAFALAVIAVPPFWAAIYVCAAAVGGLVMVL